MMPGGGGRSAGEIGWEVEMGVAGHPPKGEGAGVGDGPGPQKVP